MRETIDDQSHHPSITRAAAAAVSSETGAGESSLRLSYESDHLPPVS